LFTQPGGDTLQVEQTALHLEMLGVEVHIHTTGFLKNFNTYDLLHFFNIGRPADVLPFLTKKHPPLICTSIYIDYSVVPQTAYASRSKQKLLNLNRHAQEYLKVLARGIMGTDRFPPMRFVLRGYAKSVQEVLDHCSHLITASDAERTLLQKHFSYHGDHSKIALGSEHFTPAASIKMQDAVLCVARFEALKNQLNLIRAQWKGNWPLMLVGNAARNQRAYLQECIDKASSLVSFTPYITGKALHEIYRAHKVHALPSYYETTGLATLEALMSGSQVVCGKGGAQYELFKDVAFFCDPSDPESINAAVQAAMKQNDNKSAWVQKHFSWKSAAAQIQSIYQKYTA
jgi:glycosyltransferase involved in cell wall biosynthesis